MTNNIAEIVIGAIVLLVAAGFLMFMGQNTGFSSEGSDYVLSARFRSVEGIVVGSDVRMAGVKIGSVTGLSLDPETYLANATLSITTEIKVPDDSDATVASEGLLGGAFVEVTPGGSEFMLSQGEEILNTQGAVSLLNLLIKYASGTKE